MIDMEYLKDLTEAMGDLLAEHIEKNSPVCITFRPCGYRFSIPGTQNEGVVRLTYTHPKMIGMNIGVYRMGTDRVYSNFFSSRTGEEMIRYLRSPEAHREWQTQIEHLSNRADEEQD